MGSESKDGTNDEPRESPRGSYAEEHPAGYLASRGRLTPTERVGHSARYDQPGYGPYGGRQLPTGPRELTLSGPPPAQSGRPSVPNDLQRAREVGDLLKGALGIALGVTFDHGCLTLTGEVEDQGHVTRAEALCRELPFVTEVRSLLRIATR